MHTLWPELEEIVRSRNFVALRDRLTVLEPADLADLMSTLPAEDMVLLFRVLPRKDSAATFEYLPFEKQEALLRAMGQSEVAAILNEMSPDDRTALLEELPSEAARKLIKLLTPDERRVAQSLLGYPEGSVGRLMTPDFIAIHEDWTVQQVLDFVREFGRDSETLNIIYVVDEHNKLIDDVRMREFLLRPLNTETLATYLYQYATRGSFEDGALAALLIVLAGLLPVVWLVRLTERRANTR